MGVVLEPEHEVSKELARWEKPYRFEPFPQMVYKAQQRDNGRWECGDPLVAVGDPAAMTFTQRCQRVVTSEAELKRAHAEGWRETPTLALEAREHEERAIARAAAEAHHRVTKMSPKAQAEHKKRDAATHQHLPEG